MGTDVYLEWDGMPKSVKKARKFTINEGSKGYLRASIGMTRENKVIFMFFDSADEGIYKDFVSFDFQKNYDLALKLALSYILGVLGLIEMQFTERQRQAEEAFEIVKSLLLEVKKSDKDFNFEVFSLSFRDSIMWIESFLEFVELGLKLQKEGKNPRVFISY